MPYNCHKNYALNFKFCVDCARVVWLDVVSGMHIVGEVLST